MNVKTDMSYKTDVSQDSKYISQIYHTNICTGTHVYFDGSGWRVAFNIWILQNHFVYFILFCVCQILMRDENCILIFLQLEIEYEDYILYL